MRTLDKLLTFVAACLSALAVIDPIGVPRWVQVVAAVLVTGFAAIGIYTPAPVGDRAPPAERRVV